jgi:hypothetical protein
MILRLAIYNKSPDIRKSLGLTLYGLARASSWERVPPALRFHSMLLSLLTFVSR